MSLDDLDPRLVRRFTPEPNSGCWLWTGYVAPDGYGQLCSKDFPRDAHRAVYEAIKGEIPAGMHLDHICRQRSCVNPDHLRPVTRRQNVLENSESLTARNLAKKCCPKCGGEYTQNPYSANRRQCVPCLAAYGVEWQRRQRAKRRAQGLRWDGKPYKTRPPLSGNLPPRLPGSGYEARHYIEENPL